MDTVTGSEAVFMTGIGNHTLCEWARAGVVPAEKDKSGAWVYDREALLAYRDEHLRRQRAKGNEYVVETVLRRAGIPERETP